MEQSRLDVIKYPKDAYITLIEDKHIADQFFIILSGKVHIIKEIQIASDGNDDTLGPGDFFGVISTMSGHRHIETAQAITDVSLIIVRRQQFGCLIQNNAPVAIKIIVQFSKRMRYLDDTLAMYTTKRSVSIDVDNLYDVAVYYARQNRNNQAYYAYRQYIAYCPNGGNVQAAREQLNKLASRVKASKLSVNTSDMERFYPRDTMIFAQGEPGEEFFIIRGGSVKIVKIVKDSEVLLAILKPGDIFGEMALLEFKPRGASAVAYEDCQLMVVTRANFDMMIKTQPQLISRLTTMLAERIWMVYRQLANARINDPLGRIYDMLIVQLEKKRINLQKKQECLLDFGTTELFEMVGLSQNGGSTAFQKLMQNRYVKIIKGKICVTNVLEFYMHASYYRKILDRKTTDNGK